MTGMSYSSTPPDRPSGDSTAALTQAPAEFTIAVIEDDEDIRENVCSFLGKAGFHLWGADSAEDFYVRLLHEKADLVVVDLNLPGEDGLSLVRRLAERHVPVIVTTARGQLSDRIEGLDAGRCSTSSSPRT